MSHEPTGPDFPAGNFISENAVRAVFGRRRATSPGAPAHTAKAAPLRRWSVAQLIANAVPRPPSTT